MYSDGRPSCVLPREVKHLSGYIFKNIFLRKAHIYGNAVMFRRKCFDEAGSYDMNLTRLGCEDRDLWLRIAKKYKVKYIDKNLAFYRVHDQSASHKVGRMLEGRLYVIDKFCPVGGKYPVLRRLALAKIYKESGDSLLFEYKYDKARGEYLKAFLHYNFIDPAFYTRNCRVRDCGEQKERS